MRASGQLADAKAAVPRLCVAPRRGGPCYPVQMALRLGGMRVLVAALVLLTGACSSGNSRGSGTGGAGGSGTGGSGTGGSGTGGSGTGCSGTGGADPLETGLVAQQTSVSVDKFDCEILKWTAHYGEPDPMIFKAIIYVESRFEQTAVACPNLPCGTPSGWTPAESGCFGLMQVVPACGPTPDNAGLLSNGHPNLTKDTTASGWAGSIFNPDNNIHVGIAGLAGNRAQEKKKFSGCTEDQYTLMAMGDYNSYGSTKSCTQYNSTYDNLVLDAYNKYSTAAGYAAHKY